MGEAHAWEETWPYSGVGVCRRCGIKQRGRTAAECELMCVEPCVRKGHDGLAPMKRSTDGAIPVGGEFDATAAREQLERLGLSEKSYQFVVEALDALEDAEARTIAMEDWHHAVVDRLEARIKELEVQVAIERTDKEVAEDRVKELEAALAWCGHDVEATLRRWRREGQDG